ncbi:hypothetical protein BDZ97DRAFT_1728766 [Flammula alnicola]|nr:hypothetical protein BDZ97DRAFT_1728766 [Flammula alnicola]
MPSMFTNSKELHINGGQFVVSSNKVEVHSQNGLDLLLKRSTLAARLDSKERNDPARCHPNTRAAVIREIMDWIRSEDPSPSMMWMRGPAGAGKTALAQSIGELCQKEEDLAASFFFSRTAVSSDQSDGGTLIPTIAYQLAFSYPEAKILIRRRIEKDPSVLELSNRTVMEKLLIEPFNSWLTVILCWITATFLFRWMGWFQPRLIVIDGLDECRGEETQCELLKVIGSTIQLLPRPFRILITSRPESHIQRTFGHEEIFRTINLKQLDLGVLNAEQDIRLFFSDKFEEIRKKHRLGPYLPLTWPPKEAVERLVQKASGQFIYASTVMKYLESPRHQPTSRLDIILGISPTPDQDTPFAQLDALYTFIFSSVDDFQTVRRIFGVLIVPRAEDDDLGDFTTPAMIEKLLCLNLGHVELVLDEFLSLVHLGAHDEPIKLHHASVADFLLNRSRSGDFYMDLGVVHEDLARGYMRLIRDEELNGRIQQPQSYVSPFSTIATGPLLPITCEMIWKTSVLSLYTNVLISGPLD